MMMNYPKEFYESQKNIPSHLIGYGLALGLMAIGIWETGHGIYYGAIKKEEQPMISWALGPVVLASGGIATYSYLKYAKVI